MMLTGCVRGVLIGCINVWVSIGCINGWVLKGRL